jgi:hypothetical protein
VTSVRHGCGFYEEPFPIKRYEQHPTLFDTYHWLSEPFSGGAALHASPLQPHAHKKAVTVRDDVIPSLEPHHRPLHLRTSLHLPPRLHPRARLPCNHHQLRSAASVLLSSSCPLSPISSSTTRFFCCSQRTRVCNMSSHLPVSPSRGSHVYLSLDILQFVDSGSILADIFHSLRWLPLSLPPRYCN